MRRQIKAPFPEVFARKDFTEDLDAADGIRRGLVQARKSEGRSVDEVFDELEREEF
ncbi:MAG: hypothetical protein WBD45_02450 [Terriglobales bacterium]